MLEKITLSFIRFSQLVDGKDINLPNKINPADAGFVGSRIQVVLQFVFGTMGAVAVLIIAIAGMQYVLSQGDSQKIGRAKDTILYAVIGLVVALLAFSIVTFVIGKIF